ncbi:hypothetical protein JCM3766R1_002091 [Sporobolomyces carnicolor]
MDNIPVDAPAPSASYQPSSANPHHAQSGGGGAAAASSHQSNGGGALNFDENLKDIPQELAGQQQQGSRFNSSTGNLPAYPSVLAPAPTPHHFSPAPGIPPNAPPQTLPPLQPQGIVNADGTVTPAPVKRPRGRPRKIPGVDARPAQPRPEGTTAGRGRPRGSRGTRGRGRPRGSGLKGRGAKRGRASSSEDDEGDISVDDSSEDENRGSKRGRKDDDDVDLNEEVDDDFGPEGKVGATTKFGRKISKPKSFVPTNKPTITRKKRQSTMAAFEAALMCQTCQLGHSPPGNALVICDSCSQGYHQLCHVPILTDELVASDLPFFCKACDEKIGAMKKEENVLEGEWTTGQGENKFVKAQELPEPPAAAAGGEGGDAGEKKKDSQGEGQAQEGAAEKKAEPTEEEKEAEKTKPYTEAIKKEWLLSLPASILAGYILSVEKKFAPSESPDSGLPIWPKDLPAKLQAAKDQRAAEAAERERRLEEEAEALAAAVAAADTPGGTETNSEVGTPITFERLQPGDTAGGGARTAASKRLASEREARTAAQAANAQASKDQQVQQEQQPQQGGGGSGRSVPAYMRPAIPMASALGGGDIQVGGPSGTSSNGISNAAAAAVLAHQQQQQAQQAAAAAAQAQAQSQANRYAAYPAYSQTPASTSAYGNVGGGYGFMTGSTQGANSGVAGGYQSPAPGVYANMYAQPPSQHQPGQAGGYPTGNGAGSPWDRPHGGN